MAGIVQELLALGVGEVSIGDTLGAAIPAEVESTLAFLLRECPTESLAMHFQDTYGIGVAITYQALRMGISTLNVSTVGSS